MMHYGGQFTRSHDKAKHQSEWVWKWKSHHVHQGTQPSHALCQEMLLGSKTFSGKNVWTLCCSQTHNCQKIDRKCITSNSLSNNNNEATATNCFDAASLLQNWCFQRGQSTYVFSEQLPVIEFSCSSMIPPEGLNFADCHCSASGNCAIDLCQMVTLCQWCSNGDWTLAG